jgi:hypothetical protein
VIWTFATLVFLVILALFARLGQTLGPLPNGWLHPNVPPALLPKPPEPPAPPKEATGD